jgi:hypothetical protein
MLAIMLCMTFLTMDMQSYVMKFNRETAARRFNFTRVQSLVLAFSSELSVSESLLITTTSLRFVAFNTLRQLDSGRWLELQRSTIRPQALPC